MKRLGYKVVLPTSKSVSINWRMRTHHLVHSTLHKSPMPPAGFHSELDESQLLDWMVFVSIKCWLVWIGCLDIVFAILSLSHFSATPQIGHLVLAVNLFGYLEKYLNWQIVLDSHPFVIEEELHQKSFHPDFLEDYIWWLLSERSKEKNVVLASRVVLWSLKPGTYQIGSFAELMPKFQTCGTRSRKFWAPSPTPNDWDPPAAYRFYLDLCHVVIDEVWLAFP
jgi:hypothetical protein